MLIGGKAHHNFEMKPAGIEIYKFLYYLAEYCEEYVIYKSENFCGGKNDNDMQMSKTCIINSFKNYRLDDCTDVFQ